MSEDFYWDSFLINSDAFVAVACFVAPFFCVAYMFPNYLYFTIRITSDSLHFRDCIMDSFHHL